MRPYPTRRPANRLRYDYDPHGVRTYDDVPFEVQLGPIEALDPPRYRSPPTGSASHARISSCYQAEDPRPDSEAGPAMPPATVRWPPAWDSPWSSGGGYAATHAPHETFVHPPPFTVSDLTSGSWRGGVVIAEDDYAFSTTAETLDGEINDEETDLLCRPWLSTERYMSSDHAERHALAVHDGDARPTSRWTPFATPAWEHGDPERGWATYHDSAEQYPGSFSSETDYERYDQRRMSVSSFEDRSPSSFEALQGGNVGAPTGLFSESQLPPPWTPVRSERLDYSLLPPLPDSPPLSAAAYSLGSPTGRTFSSFAALSLEATDTPERLQYLREDDMQDVVSAHGHEEDRERQPFNQRRRGSGHDAVRLRDGGHSLEALEHLQRDGDEGDVRIKFEPVSTPELPPSPIEPFSPGRSGAHVSEQSLAYQCSASQSNETQQGRGVSRSTRKTVLRDYSSDEDDEDDYAKEESPEWTPTASSSSARPLKSPRAAGLVRRGTGSSILNAPRPSYAAPDRISPITGLPVKAISKRSWPPKDAHKRKFACTIPGCKKTFGRPSARDTHLRSHNGQKPFTCPVPQCARAFSVFSNLKRHMVVHPTVDFRQVAVHDLPSMHWVPFEPEDPGWLVPGNEGGRLEWIDEEFGELGEPAGPISAGHASHTQAHGPPEHGVEAEE